MPGTKPGSSRMFFTVVQLARVDPLVTDPDGAYNN